MSQRDALSYLTPLQRESAIRWGHAYAARAAAKKDRQPTPVEVEDAAIRFVLKRYVGQRFCWLCCRPVCHIGEH
jgi:hypothetical protein